MTKAKTTVSGLKNPALVRALRDANKSAPMASEATQRKINRVRGKHNKSNTAVSDPLTGTDRAAQGTRKGARQGAVTLTYKADFTPHAGIEPGTGVMLDPLSAFTRPQMKLVDPEFWADLRDKVAIAKGAGRGALYLAEGVWGLNVVGRKAAWSYIIAKRHDGKWVAYHKLSDGTLAIVTRRRG